MSVPGASSLSDIVLEATFWSSWCGLNIWNWQDTRSEWKNLPRPDVDHPPEIASHIQKIKKNFFLASLSVVTGFSMVGSWAHEAQLLSLGAFAPIISALGFGTSSIVSSVKTWDNLCEFDRGIHRFNAARRPGERTKIALDQVEALLKIAFYTSIAAWGAFGALHATFGGELLFWAMDTSLYYGLVFLVANLASIVVLSILRHAGPLYPTHTKA